MGQKEVKEIEVLEQEEVSAQEVIIQTGQLAPERASLLVQ
jgi:hypothetical protein